MYDVLIVGCGIIGAATAYELSRYRLKTGVLESSNDVANGATKANNAILHAGYDSPPGTLEAKLVTEGIGQAEALCRQLDVEYRSLPAMVVAASEPQMKKVRALCEQGRKNGVPGIRLLDRGELLEREPHLNPNMIGGMLAPRAAIVNPWELCIALAETAVRNGAEVHLSAEVLSIRKEGDVFVLTTTKGTFRSRYLVNAAGNFSDRVHEMVGGSGFRHTYYAGGYFVFDKSQHGLVNSLIFSCSTENGFKGTTVFPSVHGNLLAGPDYYQAKSGDDVGTVPAYMRELRDRVLDIVPSIDFRTVIHEYAGVRPTTEAEDFIIGESPACKNFVNLAGMKSPALSAAPAIARMGVEILRGCGLPTPEKEGFHATRKRIKFRELDTAGKRAVIAQNPLYGRVICRCETVTEGEIVEAIRRPITPRTIDAVKRRCNAGMGRCQGGFCGPRVHEILARELGLPPTDILLDEEGSYLLTGPTKEGACFGGF